MNMLTKQARISAEDTTKKDTELQKEANFWDYLSNEALTNSGL